jgi:hypothetical protein
MTEENKDGTNSQDVTSGNDDEVKLTPQEVKKEIEKRQKLQGELTDLKKKYDTFSSMYKDIDPDEARELKKKLEEAERKAAEKDPAKMEEVWSRKLQKQQGDWESEKTTLKSQLEKLQRENKTLTVTDKVMTEIGGLFNSDAHKFIKMEIESRCDRDEDGNIFVKDENGDPWYKAGKPGTIKDLGELLADQYPSLAKATGTPGGKDSTPGHRTNGRVVRYPETMAELQAMPNSREIWAKMQAEKHENVAKILKNTSIG